MLILKNIPKKIHRIYWFYRNSTKLKYQIDWLRKSFLNSSNELGTKRFHLVSGITPIVNVDLLIQKFEKQKRYTLLTWRQDEFYSGWHIPGGVIRYKEKMKERVSEVAILELGTSIAESEGPIEIHEHINNSRKVRGHFISLLFRCTLNSEPNKNLMHLPEKILRNGVWMYHSKKPSDLIVQQNVYSKYF